MSIVNDFMPGNLGPFNGVPVVESRAMPYDAVLFDTFSNRILCGEVGHVRWLFDIAAWKRDVRADVQKIIDDFERSVLTAR